MVAEHRLEARGTGPWGVMHRVEVTRSQLQDYAAATGYERARAHPEPPVFGAALIFPILEQTAYEFIPEHLRDRGLHAAHELRRLAPMPPGSYLCRARLAGLQPGRSGARVLIASETATESGTPVDEQLFVVTLRGVEVSNPDERAEVRADVRAQPVPAPLPQLGTFTQTFPPGTPAAYAAASGDHRAIHLDDQVARNHGLPGAVTHGLCTLAFVLRGAQSLIDPDGSMFVRRASVRFTGPVQPHMSLTTLVRSALTPPAEGLYAFETTADGAPALGHGIAEMSQRSVPAKPG